MKNALLLIVAVLFLAIFGTVLFPIVLHFLQTIGSQLRL